MKSATALAAATVAWLGGAGHACEIEFAGAYKEAMLLCEDGLPGSKPRCQRLLRTLAEIDNPTREQRLALALGRSSAASFTALQEKDFAILDQANIATRDELRALADDYPNDPAVVYALVGFEDDEERNEALLRRTLALDPGCTSAAYFLAEVLESGDTDDAEREEEAGEVRMQGYVHATDPSWKFLFAAMIYRRSLYDGKPEAASAFRSRVLDDMALASLPFDADDRAASLGLICHGHAFAMGFEALCLNALRLLARRDRRDGVPLGEDALEAIAKVGHAVVRDKHLDAGDVMWLDDVHYYGLVAAVHDKRFGADGVDYLIAVRDLLDAEPEERRTSAYHVAYSRVVGAQREVAQLREVAELRKAVELDPGDGQAGLWLARALERADRFHEAKAVYRHVMAYDDRRPRGDGESESYGKKAERYLRELEER